MAWTDERKEQAIDAYQAANPTAENSMEIVKSIAEDMDESANGVRMILSKAGVYVKKEQAASKKAASGDKPASTRVSKEDAHAKLQAAIEATGAVADMEIVSKLTGKAALYIAGVLESK